MVTLYDEEGNAIEGALPPDEAKTLQEQINLKEVELTKLKSKDNNFRALKDKTKQERDEIISKWDSEKQILMGEIEDLRVRVDGRDAITTEQVKTTKATILKEVAGNDEALQKEIQEQYDKIGNPIDPVIIADQYEAAKLMVEKRRERINSVNPINAYTPSSYGTSPSKSKTSFADTSAGKSLAKELGLNISKKS